MSESLYIAFAASLACGILCSYFFKGTKDE